MADKMFENNQSVLAGEIVSGFTFSHEVCGEKFYNFQLSSERLSNVPDVINVIISERLIDVNDKWKGQFVKVTGQFRSFNLHEENKNRLILYVFAREIDFAEEFDNKLVLDGYLCKQPVYRKTPLGREIADLLVAVNRSYGKSDYIPCICWGRNAKFAANLEVGTHVKINGRIQSRNYLKRISENETEEHTAYEVSISKIEL